MKKSLFSLIGIVAMLLGSCAQETGKLGDIDQPIGDNTLRVSVNVKESSSATRVAAIEGEKEVQNLYLLFFEPSSDGSGEFVDFIEIGDPENGDLPQIGPAENDIDVTGTLLDITSAYNILAIANIYDPNNGVTKYLDNDSVEGWMSRWAGKTESQVIAEAIAWAPDNYGDGEYKEDFIFPYDLLMSGRTAKREDSFKVELELEYNLIRFDVRVADDDYVLGSLYIRNAYPMSKIWSDGTSAGSLDYTEGTARIKEYYGYGWSDLVSDPPYTTDEVRGGFYVFENQVAMPVQNDNMTTALIVGLHGSNGLRHYRVNIAPDQGAQMLPRHHAYMLTINSVIGEGHTNPEDAYNDPDNDLLNYTINQWGGGDAGVSDQDDSSMLSSPYKVVNLDLETGAIIGRAERGLSPNSFDITTITNLAAGTYSDLAIMGEPEFHLNGSDAPYKGIEVNLSGNTLVFYPVATLGDTVDGIALKSSDKITGSIVLGFAGLRVTIEVLQTDVVEEFLNVFLPEGGIPRFAPFSGIESEDIRVEASGPWSAKILSENGGFKFASPSEGLSLSAQPINGIFTVKTDSDNSLPGVREAFVVVTLDSDPLNVSKVVRLTQQAKAEIAIIPSQSVTFNGTYGTSSDPNLDGELAAIPNNTRYTFEVRPGYTGTSGESPQNKWYYRIDAQNASGSYETVYNEVGGLVQGKENWFKITPTHSETANVANSISVDVTGRNTTGRVRRAKLVVFLVENENATSSIDLIQQTSSIALSPSTVPAVPKIGGTSQAIGVVADASLSWTIANAADIKTVSGTNSRGLTLKRHEAKLLLSGGSNDGQPVVVGTAYPISQKFKVSFPKIYYPNREIPISAQVKVSIVGSDLSATINVNQTTLTPNRMNVWGLYGAPNYNLGNTYHRGWDGNSGNVGLRQIPGYNYLGSSYAPTTSSVNSSVNYLQLEPHSAGGGYNWSVFNEFVTKRDGWVVITNPDNAGVAPINNGNSPLKKAGYPSSVYGGDRNGVIDTRRSTSKIYQFIFEEGPADVNLTDEFYVDGVNTHIQGALPSTAVPLIKKENSDNQALLIIDIENKFLWSGELQMFWYDYYLTNGRGTLLNNLMHFIGNASKYGSHFTDLFLEEDVPAAKQIPAVDGGRYAQPAPWSDEWGANKGVTK